MHMKGSCNLISKQVKNASPSLEWGGKSNLFSHVFLSNWHIGAGGIRKGPNAPDVFKLVYYVTTTVSKRAVDI